VETTISSTDFLHKFEAPAFPPRAVHGRTGDSFEAAATNFIEDGASGESFGCLRVRAERGVYVRGMGGAG